MRISNIKIALILITLTVVMMVAKDGNMRQHIIATNPGIATVTNAAKEVHGVLNGSIGVEKYINVERIMDSMVY